MYSIDVNLLTTWQQVCLFGIPIFTNPMFIHSSVVFIRLYWFEKRFKHIIDENRNRLYLRRNRARSQDSDVDLERRGVRGREIVVLHRPMDVNFPNPSTIEESRHSAENSETEKFHPVATPSKSTSTDDSSNGPLINHKREDSSDAKRPTMTQDIRFKLPEKRQTESVPRFEATHEVIFEDDVNPPLVIKGPRDYDSEDGEVKTLQRARTMTGLEVAHNGISTPHPNKLPKTATVEGSSSSTRLEMRRRSTLERILPKSSTLDRAISTALRRRRDGSPASHRSSFSQSNLPYLSFSTTLGRNSTFYDLTEEQRKELGGVEYRALRLLAVILVAFITLFSIFGVICLVPWIINSGHYGRVVDQLGISRTWWGFFTAIGAFTDLGFTLTPDSMISFQDAVFVLMVMSFLIVIG